MIIYHTIKYVNNAFEKLTGYSLNEISGLDFSHVHQLESNDHFDKHVSHGNVNKSLKLLNQNYLMPLTRLFSKKVWESELSFSKSNGEITNHLATTIPVIVQGETK